jgi:AcrR family transcriptional regulator
MTTARRAYHHGDLRNALVMTGARLVEQGFGEGFSLREVARDVGVSANAAYRHFADKSALLNAVAAHGFQGLAQRMHEAINPVRSRGARALTATDRFFAGGHAYVDLAVEQPQMFRLMFGPSGMCCFTEQGVAFEGPRPIDLLGLMLDGLVADGRMTPKARQGAELKVWAVVHGFASLVLDGLVTLQEPSARNMALDSLLKFTVDGLCQSAPTDTKRQ